MSGKRHETSEETKAARALMIAFPRIGRNDDTGADELHGFSWACVFDFSQTAPIGDAASGGAESSAPETDAPETGAAIETESSAPVPEIPAPPRPLSFAERLAAAIHAA